VAEIMSVKPDVIVSGINVGPNVGINVLYSGTVSAATEGAILGIPSMAISLGIYRDPDFCFAADFAGRLIGAVDWQGLPKHTMLNVNVPALPAARIKGVRFVRQGTAAPFERFDRRTDPRGNTYYWLASASPAEIADLGSDEGALASDHITITPLCHDLTHHELLGALQGGARDDLIDLRALDDNIGAAELKPPGLQPQ